jgi:hypothetical protein
VEWKAKPHRKFDKQKEHDVEVAGQPAYYALLPLTIPLDIVTSPVQLGVLFAWPAARSNPATKATCIVVVQDPSTTSGSLAVALEQVRRASASSVLRTRHPVVSVIGALPEVQKVTDRPIVAVTEYKGWFWFATDVVRDSETQAIQTFISGYAVQRDGTVVSQWSIW